MREWDKGPASRARDAADPAPVGAVPRAVPRATALQVPVPAAVVFRPRGEPALPVTLAHRDARETSLERIRVCIGPRLARELGAGPRVFERLDELSSHLANAAEHAAPARATSTTPTAFAGGAGSLTALDAASAPDALAALPTSGASAEPEPIELVEGPVLRARGHHKPGDVRPAGDAERAVAGQENALERAARDRGPAVAAPAAPNVAGKDALAVAGSDTASPARSNALEAAAADADGSPPLAGERDEIRDAAEGDAAGSLESEAGGALDAASPPGGGGSIAAWSQRVSAAVDTLPAATLPAPEVYTKTIVAAGGAATARWEKKAEDVPEKAKKVLLAKQLEPLKDIPPMPAPDPVPQATAKLTAKSNRSLPDQKLPDLLTTPHGFEPTVGGPPVDTSAPPPLLAVVPAGPAPVSKTPVGKANQAATAVPEVAPVAGQGQTITGSERPPVHVVAAPQRAQLAQVLARVYTEASASGAQVIDDARAGAYSGLDLRGRPATMGLGADLIPEETAWFRTEMERVAEAAQIGKKALEDAVASRKKAIDESQEKDSQALARTSDEQAKAVSQKAADATATIRSVRERWDEHWDRVAAEAKGGVDPKAVRAEQERLSQILRKHSSDHVIAWSGMQKERNKKLDRAQDDQLTAYREAALADECAQRQQSIVELGDAELIQWLKDRSLEVRHGVGVLKEDVQKAVDGWQAEMRVARDEGIDLVRDWADKRIGRERGWLESLLDRLFAAIETKHEETAALADAQTGETVTALGEDLQLIEDLKKTGYEKLERDQKDQLKKQDKQQQDLLKAYIEGPDKGDTVLYLAKMLQLRLRRQRLPEAIKQIRSQVLALDNVSNWADLEALGKTQKPSFSAQTVADQLWAAFEHTWGTDEDKAYAAVQGLTAEQGKAVRGAYQFFHNQDLDWRMRDEMSGSELDRVVYGIDGKQAEADAAALRDAVQGWGTDEALINKVLRNKTPAERIAINEAYKSLYGEELKSRLDSELSGDEQAITDAHWEGNTERADAIEVKVAKEGFWGPDQDKMEEVYTRVRDEATQYGDARGWKSAEIDAEIARRTGKMQVEYKSVTQREMLADLEQAFSPPQNPNGDPYQREAADQYWKGRRDLVLGLATGDLTRADAGKIQIERTGLYAKDDTINKVLALQYDRAYERERRDALVEYAESHGGASPKKEDLKTLEADAQQRAQAKGKQSMAALGLYFETNYTHGQEKFQDTIIDLTQGVDEEKAVALVSQGGYLEDWQVLEYATKGLGTDDDALKKLLKGKKSRTEIEALEKKWQEKTGRKGVTIEALVEDETSGRLKNDLLLDCAYGGEPEDPKAMLAKAEKQLEFEKKSGGVDYVMGPNGRVEVKNHEYQVIEKRLELLRAQAAEYDSAQQMPDTDPRKAWANLKWQASTEGFASAIETHRFLVDQRTELVAQIVSMTVAIAVGVLLTVATGGVGSAGAVALIAGVSSLFGAASGIAVKASMKGAAYGADELGTDIAIGVVDTLISAATAGVGGKILKSAAGVAKAGGSGVLGTLGRMAEGNAAKRAAAHFIAEGAEGFLQSLPTSVLGTALNEQTWKEGNPFFNMLVGAGTGVAMGTFASGAIGGLTNLRKAEMPGLPGVHEAPPAASKTALVDAHANPVKVAELEARYFELNPTRSKADFRRDFDAVLMKQAEHDPDVATKLTSQLRDEITDLLPPHHKSQLADSPVEMWDQKRFEEFTGSKKGQAVVIIKDGKPTVIVKQGADPHALAEEGFHLVQALDPKTQSKVARLSEEKMASWSSLDPREKLSLYREKLDLEIDAQKQMLGALEARAKASGGGDELAERLAMAKGTLDNLETRLRDLDRIGPFKRTLMGWGVAPTPSWLDQPARLFSKLDPPRLSAVRSKVLRAAREADNPAVATGLKQLIDEVPSRQQRQMLDSVMSVLEAGEPSQEARLKLMSRALAGADSAERRAALDGLAKLLKQAPDGQGPMPFQKITDFILANGDLDVKSLLHGDARNIARMIDVMADQPALKNVLLKQPKALESMLKHPEAIGFMEEALQKLKATKDPPLVAPVPPSLKDHPAFKEDPLREHPGVKLSEELQTAQSAAKKQDALKFEQGKTQRGFDPASMKEGTPEFRAYMDQQYKDAARAMRQLKAMTQKVADQTHGKPGWRQKLKDMNRAIEKIFGEYHGNASNLVDLAGSKIVYKTLDDLYSGLEHLHRLISAHPRVEWVNFKDRFFSPSLSGYRDILISLRMTNGHVAEFRLHLESVDELADIDHALYEVTRSMGPLAKAQKRGLTANEQAIIAAVNETTQPHFDARFLQGRGGTTSGGGD